LLRGQVFLDKTFTRQALFQILNQPNVDAKNPHNVLHIATNFSIRPGALFHAPLLHDDGSTYSIAAMGATFQQKGTKAVMGMLLVVQANSTSALMRLFYQKRGKKRAMSKVQALWAAQLTLVRRKQNAVDWSHPSYWARFVLMGNWL
jgi:CHAT domain